jgi:hypothetical protein
MALLFFFSLSCEFVCVILFVYVVFWFVGTDCQDCGPVGAENFTRIDDDGWWDDDDDYWAFNDGNFLGKKMACLILYGQFYPVYYILGLIVFILLWFTFFYFSTTEQTSGLESNRDKVRRYQFDEEESAGSMFLVVLEGMVYTVGAIFFAAAAYIGYRWFHGKSVPFMNGFNSEMSASEFEMRPTQRMQITPDEFRT